ITHAMPKAATRVKSPTAEAERTEELGSNRQHRKHRGNPRARQKLHGSLETMAAKPAKRFLSAVWKHHYRKNDSQDQPHHATVSLRQPLKYIHRSLLYLTRMFLREGRGAPSRFRLFCSSRRGSLYGLMFCSFMGFDC